MSAYTDADLRVVAQQIDHPSNPAALAKSVLDAVAPAIAARALRDAADPDEVDDIEGSPVRDADGHAFLWLHQSRQVSEWLRGRADEIERAT